MKKTNPELKVASLEAALRDLERIIKRIGAEDLRALLHEIAADLQAANAVAT